MLRKIAFEVVFCVAAALCVVCLSAGNAVALVSGDYEYTVSGTNATITKYTGSGGSVSVPATIDGNQVVAIGSSAFRNCAELTSVTIPSGVTSIGSSAFENCTGLTSMTIPDGVTSIGTYLFSGCSSLSSIALGSGLTDVPTGTFSGTAIESLVIPKGVTTMGSSSYGALNGASELKTVIFEDGIKAIPSYALYQSGGSTITGVAIPDGIASIGSYAFRNCTGLTEITIPSGATSIGSSAFSGCSSLASVALPDSVVQIGSNAFTGYTGTLHIGSEDSFASIYAIDNEIRYSASNTGIADKSDRYLLRNSTSYHTSLSTVTTSGYVNLNMQYDFKEAAKPYISNVRLKVKLPSSSSLLQDTFKLNGEQTGVLADESGYINIALGQASGNISFGVALSDSMYLMSYAQITYQYSGGSKTETIGIINMANELLTIALPDETSEDAFVVSGYTAPDKTVSIYLDGVSVGTATASKTGKYSKAIQLDNPQEGDSFRVESRILSNGLETKAAAYISYTQTAVEIIGCSMYYRGGVYDLLSLSGARPVISWASNSSFTFVVEFSQNANVDDVKIVSTKNGEIIKLPAVLDGNRNAFIATGFYNYVPGAISIEYGKNEKNAFEDTQVTLEYSYDDESAGLIGYQTEVAFNDSTEFYYLREYAPDTAFTATDDYSRTVYAGRNCYVSNELIYLAREDAYFVCKELYLYQDNGLYTMIRTGIGTTESQDAPQAAMSVMVAALAAGSGGAADVYDKTKDLLGVLTDLPEKNQDDTIYLALKEYIDTAKGALDSGSTEYWQLTAIEAKLDTYNLINKQGRVFNEINKYISNSFTMADDPKFLPGKMDDKMKKSIEKEMKESVNAMKKCANNIANSTLRDVVDELTKRGFLGLDDSLIEKVEKAVVKSEKSGSENAGVNFNAKYSIDPSGYVYEAVVGNRLHNVKTTIYYKDHERGNTVAWIAEEYDQKNPLYTDAFGCYAWDVPEGLWQVKYELDDYEAAYSAWLPVPPPQLDVNIGMVSLAAPAVANVAAYPEGVEITFSKYMKVETLDGSITITQNDLPVSGTVQAQDAENGLATVFRFVPSAELDAESVKVSVSGSAESYANVNLASAYEQNISVVLEPKTMSARDINIDYDSTEGDIIVTVTPADAAAGKIITAISSDQNIATVAASTAVEATGTAKIRVTPQLSGIADISLSLNGSTLSTQAKVNVGLDEFGEDAPSGVSVAGKVISYNPGAATTLKLMQGETEIGEATIAPAAGSGQAEQAFMFEDVAPGTYALVVAKPGHTKYTVQNIIVGDADVDLAQDPRPGAALITLLCGDVNGDGSINDADLTILWRAANYNKNASAADNPLCDLDGSGAVNDGDLTILWRSANYNRGAVTIGG